MSERVTVTELNTRVKELFGSTPGLKDIWVIGEISNFKLYTSGHSYFTIKDAGSEIQVEYFALPETIPADAEDDYEFEIDEDACECMPFYVAAQQLLPDLVMDYGGMLGMYDRAVGLLRTEQPGEHGRIGQTFYGR